MMSRDGYSRARAYVTACSWCTRTAPRRKWDSFATRRNL